MKHVLLSLGGLLTGLALHAQTGAVADFEKISQTSGNLNAELLNQGKFGFVSASGSPEVLVGAPFAGNGELYILELNDAGAVAAQSIIKASNFSLFDTIVSAEFGTAACVLGDMNSDGVDDYLVGAPGLTAFGGLVVLLSNGEELDAYAVQVPEPLRVEGARLGSHLERKANRFTSGLESGFGKVIEFTINASFELQVLHIFDETTPVLSPLLGEGDRFGAGISIADLNGDGIDDILCGAPGDDDGGVDYGAVYQLYRDSNGEVSQVVKLSTGQGNFNGFLNSNDDFGISTAVLGDLDQDGFVDIAVAAPGDDDGNIDVGAIWIIFLRENGTMKRQRKINLNNGNFFGHGLGLGDRFGTRIANLGDLNGDGTVDLAVAAPNKDDGGNNRGAFYTVMIEFCEVPTAIFEYDANGTTVQFSIPGGAGYTYIWNFSDGGFSEQQHPVHTFDSGGTYTVCLTINGTCEGNFYCGPVQVSGNALGTNDMGNSEVEVYPNPATEFMKVACPERIIRAIIFDLIGNQVWSADIGMNKTSIDITQLPKGLYILNLLTASGQVAKKVQVM
jgi:hypothetical protein